MRDNEDAEDGIDYQLLGKDQSACSPAELDKIRRERNRMHAKRTRDRKRIFMEEMEAMIRQLEEDNGIFANHVEKINRGAMAVSPDLGPVVCPLAPASAPLSALQDASSQPLQQHEPPQQQPSSSRGDFLNQIESPS
jgi:hypothetical protein